MIKVSFLVLLVFAAWVPLRADTIVVDQTGGGDFTEIQAAIDEADDGDTVLVMAGTYVVSRPIDFNGGPGPFKNITLRSDAGPQQTTIRMAEVADDENSASVVVFRSGEDEESLLEGFTIAGGRGTLYSIPYGVRIRLDVVTL